MATGKSCLKPKRCSARGVNLLDIGSTFRTPLVLWTSIAVSGC
jgi:hypothetical protein